jgi:hypothetical protein
MMMMTFPVVGLLAPVAAMGALAHPSPSEHALLLRCAVPAYGHTISVFSFASLALCLCSSPALLLRGAVRPFPSFEGYTSLVLV